MQPSGASNRKKRKTRHEETVRLRGSLESFLKPLSEENCLSPIETADTAGLLASALTVRADSPDEERTSEAEAILKPSSEETDLSSVTVAHEDDTGDPSATIILANSPNTQCIQQQASDVVAKANSAGDSLAVQCTSDDGTALEDHEDVSCNNFKMVLEKNDFGYLANPVSDNIRVEIVKIGPQRFQNKQTRFFNTDGRSFSKKWFKKQTSNGEEVKEHGFSIRHSESPAIALLAFFFVMRQKIKLLVSAKMKGFPLGES
jgi:hypothetical protein